MPNIELVIKMSEKVYEELKRGLVCVRGQRSGKTLLSELASAIHNGIPLSKGHGDLITKEQAIDLVEFYQLNPQHFDFVNLIEEIKDEKPIIEAAKEENEVDK